MLFNKSNIFIHNPITHNDSHRSLSMLGFTVSTLHFNDSNVLCLYFLSFRWYPHCLTQSWGKGWYTSWRIKWASQISASSWCQTSHFHSRSVQAATRPSQLQLPLRTPCIPPNRLSLNRIEIRCYFSFCILSSTLCYCNNLPRLNWFAPYLLLHEKFMPLDTLSYLMWQPVQHLWINMCLTWSIQMY